MANKKALVPRLRFPEFRDAGEWEAKTLEKYTTKIGSGITPRGGDKNYRIEGRPFVRSQNIGWGELILDDIVYIDEETHSSFSSTEIVANDVLLNISGASIGRSSIANELIAGGNVNQHVCIIRTKINKLNPIFLNQFLLSQEGQKQIDSFQAGGNRQGLNFGQIRSFSIPFPVKLEEQQKIADCLSSLDELIAAQAEKLDVLKIYKKGLMLRLFPREGEITPRLRFPEFRDSGVWKTGIVRDLISTVTPPKRLTSDQYENEGRFPVVDQSKEDICGWTNDEDALVSFDSTLIVFGDHTCILKILEKPFVQGADGIKILKTTEVIEPAFLYQYLLFSPVKMESYKRHFSTLKEKRISYPDKATGEQQRITDCLSSLDALIAAQEEKINALKTHKKGLMQQLFPTPEEVV